MKRESELRSQFLKALAKELPAFVALRHENMRLGGVPDLSITGNQITSWIEFKSADPTFSGTGLQELTCSRLAAQSRCYYVIWCERCGVKTTMVIDPNVVRTSADTPQARKPWLMEAVAVTAGWDHLWLVNLVRQWHRVA